MRGQRLNHLTMGPFGSGTSSNPEAQGSRCRPAGLSPLNELAMRLLTRDGLLVSGSCSMHLGQHELVDVMWAASRYRSFGAGGVPRWQGPDHPVNPAISETAYLKCVMARVMVN